MAAALLTDRLPLGQIASDNLYYLSLLSFSLLKTVYSKVYRYLGKNYFLFMLQPLIEISGSVYHC